VGKLDAMVLSQLMGFILSQQQTWDLLTVCCTLELKSNSDLSCFLHTWAQVQFWPVLDDVQTLKPRASQRKYKIGKAAAQPDQGQHSRWIPPNKITGVRENSAYAHRGPAFCEFINNFSLNGNLSYALAPVARKPLAWAKATCQVLRCM